MITRLRSLFLTLLLFAAAIPTFGQSSGKISGKVTDEDHYPLAFANVRVVKQNAGTAADYNGDYVLTLPAGSYTLTISYLGYSTLAEDITVEAGKTVQADFTLKGSTIQGDEVVVLGERMQGQAKALNQQKNNDNITNIISADQIGRFPDANVGDALKRVPAVTVNYDQGEARFVNVRGTEPRFNSVTINGERIPSAEAEIRNVQVDLVPSDMVQTIEVNKTLTPDMDADAIGGSINLVTRQAPNKLRVSGTLGSGYNFLSEKAPVNGALVLGNRYMDGKLGVVLNGSYYDNRLGSDNVEGTWDLNNENSYFTDEWEMRKYEIRRLRQSYGGEVDFKIDPSNTVYFQGIYNHRNDWENRYRTQYKISEEDDGSYVAKVTKQTKAGINNDENDNARLEDQKMWTASLSGEHTLGGGVKFEWSGAMSKASEDRPNERYIAWVQKNVPVSLNLSDSRKPYIYESADLTGYELDEITEEHQYTEEKDFNGKLNLEVPFALTGDYKNSLKVGGRYRHKDKKRDNSFYAYSPLSGFENILSIGNENYTDENFLAGDYKVGVNTTKGALGGLDLDNPALFEKEDQPGEYAADNYKATEKIYAGYAMWKQNLGPQFFLTFGVRLESTNIEYAGNEYSEDTEEITPTSGSDDYANVLPNIQLKYNFDENTVVHVAYTNTLARPNYYDLVPYRSIAEGNEELAVGNPELEPTTSMNLDLMAEHYYANVGIISGGVFYKKIKDFIYVYNESDYLDPVSGETYDDYYQPRNGAEADLFGFEAAFQRHLDFLPGFLRNLDFYANYTYTYSKADNPTLNNQIEGDKDIELPGTAPHTLNAALTYQDGTITLSASFNYASSYIDPDEMDLTPGLERYYDAVTYLDVNGSYAFTQQFRFFFEANNLLNQPLRYYAGDKDRTYQMEYYNVKISAGLKFDL